MITILQHKKAKGFPQGLEVHIGKTLLIRLRPNLYNEQKPGSSISVVDFSFCQDLIDDFNSVANMVFTLSNFILDLLSAFIN